MITSGRKERSCCGQSKPVRYADGSPSREIEDGDSDWEATGSEEMRQLHEECSQKKSIVSIRDDINNLRDLVEVCSASLLGENTRMEDRTRKNVAHVLYFYVDSILADIEKELSKQ